MNPNQLATIEEARAIAQQLGALGGGVKDIYIPEYIGPFVLPDTGATKFYHFRFACGAEGYNVGLIRTLMRGYPSSWLNMLGTEIANYVKQSLMFQ